MVVLNRTETRAMVVLNKTKLEQWWYSTGRNSSNGGTQQDETRAMVVLNRMKQKDDMRDNQTCVKSGLQPRIRPRQLGLQEKRLRLLAAAAATDRLVNGEQNPRSRYRTETVY